MSKVHGKIRQHHLDVFPLVDPLIDPVRYKCEPQVMNDRFVIAASRADCFSPGCSKPPVNRRPEGRFLWYFLRPGGPFSDFVPECVPARALQIACAAPALLRK